MRAAVYHEYGEPREVLSVGEIERPAPGPGEVLVQVKAAGVDRGAWHIVTGLPTAARLVFGLRRPRNPVPGLDLAGIVTAVGDSVTGFQPGDEVFGIGPGSFAEYAAAPVRKLVHKPADWSWPEAAVVAISGLTALQAVRDQAKVQPGQTVLILGASGGVGSYAVQIAAAYGARVTAVCSAAKADLVTSLGAHSVIDYRSTDPVDGSRRYDVILDIGGSRPVRRMRQALTPQGTLVIIGGEGGGRLLGTTYRQFVAAVQTLGSRQRVKGFLSKEHGPDIEVLRDMILAGDVRPPLEQTYPLDQAGQALSDLAAGLIRGKAAITIG